MADGAMASAAMEQVMAPNKVRSFIMSPSYGYGCQNPRYRGSQRASSGKVMSNIRTTNTPTSSQVTQRRVLSMGTRAMRHETIRFTASGGVNCPRATMTVRMTPNHTGSQPSALAMGMSRGTKIRKMEIPSRNMPEMVSRTMMSGITPYSTMPDSTMARAMGSMMLSVYKAQAKMPASDTTSMITADSSAASRRMMKRSRNCMVR